MSKAVHHKSLTETSDNEEIIEKLFPKCRPRALNNNGTAGSCAANTSTASGFRKKLPNTDDGKLLQLDDVGGPLMAENYGSNSTGLINSGLDLSLLTLSPIKMAVEREMKITRIQNLDTTSDSKSSDHREQIMAGISKSNHGIVRKNSCSGDQVDGYIGKYMQLHFNYKPRTIIMIKLLGLSLIVIIFSFHDCPLQSPSTIMVIATNKMPS